MTPEEKSDSMRMATMICFLLIVGAIAITYLNDAANISKNEKAMERIVSASNERIAKCNDIVRICGHGQMVEPINFSELYNTTFAINSTGG